MCEDRVQSLILHRKINKRTSDPFPLVEGSHFKCCYYDDRIGRYEKAIKIITDV